MKEMVWNSVLVWLAAAGIVAGLTGLYVLLSGELLGLVILPVSLGVLAVPIASVVSGLLAAAGRGSLRASLAIALLLGAALLYAETSGFDSFEMPRLFLSAAPLLLLLASFGAARLTAAARMSHMAAVRGAVPAAAVLLCCALFYLTAAFHSRMAYSFLPSGLFFYRPANSVSGLYLESGERRLKNSVGEPFDGVIKSYRERLTIDFITKKVSGLACYLDGYRFGCSGDAVPPVYEGSGSVVSGTVGPWCAAAPQNRGADPEVLLHQRYQTEIEREFPAGAAVFYSEEGQQGDTYIPHPMPKAVAVFCPADGIERKEVRFHPNGVVSRIDVYRCGGEGWDGSVSVITFDELGFRNDAASGLLWDEKDFAGSRYSAYDTIQGCRGKDGSAAGEITRPRYVPKPEQWVNESRVDNLVASYGLPLGTIFCYIDGHDGYWQSLSLEEGRDFLELLERGALTIGLLDDSHSIREFQSTSCAFKIVSKEERDKEIPFYYRDGKFLIGDGPYYLDPTDGGSEEGGEDRRFREELLERLAAMIESHTGKRPSAATEAGR